MPVYVGYIVVLAITKNPLKLTKYYNTIFVHFWSYFNTLKAQNVNVHVRKSKLLKGTMLQIYRVKLTTMCWDRCIVIISGVTNIFMIHVPKLKIWEETLV